MKAFVVPCLTVLLTYTLLASASTTDEDEDRISYSNWNYATPASGSQFPYIAYEIRRTGFHSVDVHFKNFAKKDISFKFWLSGFQPAHCASAVRVPVSAPNDREWIVPVELESGLTGARFAQLKMAQIRMEGEPTILSPTLPEEGALARYETDDAWMSVMPNQSLVEFGPETVICRIVHDAHGDRIVFRNTSRQNVYFNFAVAGYQLPGRESNPRVKLAIGQEQSVPVVLNHPDSNVVLARVKAFDIRIHVDGGPFLDEKDMEDGWFAVSAVHCPLFNPNQIMYRFESKEDSRIKVHFRNISRLPVTFNFYVVNPALTTPVKINAEAETVVTIPRFETPIPVSMTRVRVTDVQYSTAKSATVPTLPK